eukprot:TRINITY_DN42103_c0_g1_i1.p1 TRINITY_DN42103_c0_g1~~TRINITY_DN42103_c0_g1_i1.p1  ORF type:complete len:720 (+),score=94.87 TRINITY_DN42103_c0_g1_i1:55-2160(+)
MERRPLVAAAFAAVAAVVVIGCCAALSAGDRRPARAAGAGASPVLPGPAATLPGHAAGVAPPSPAPAPPPTACAGPALPRALLQLGPAAPNGSTRWRRTGCGCRPWWQLPGSDDGNCDAAVLSPHSIPGSCQVGALHFSRSMVTAGAPAGGMLDLLRQPQTAYSLAAAVGNSTGAGSAEGRHADMDAILARMAGSAEVPSVALMWCGAQDRAERRPQPLAGPTGVLVAALDFTNAKQRRGSPGGWSRCSQALSAWAAGYPRAAPPPTDEDCPRMAATASFTVDLYGWESAAGVAEAAGAVLSSRRLQPGGPACWAAATGAACPRLSGLEVGASLRLRKGALPHARCRQWVFGAAVVLPQPAFPGLIASNLGHWLFELVAGVAAAAEGARLAAAEQPTYIFWPQQPSQWEAATALPRRAGGVLLAALDALVSRRVVLGTGLCLEQAFWAPSAPGTPIGSMRRELGGATRGRVPPPPVPRLPRGERRGLLLLVRRPGGSRYLANWRDLAAAAEADGWRVHAPLSGGASVVDRLHAVVEAAAHCELLAALHGSELALAALWRRGGFVLEICHWPPCPDQWFAAASRGHAHFARWQLPATSVHWGNTTAAITRAAGMDVTADREAAAFELARRRPSSVDVPISAWRTVLAFATALLSVVPPSVANSDQRLARAAGGRRRPQSQFSSGGIMAAGRSLPLGRRRRQR